MRNEWFGMETKLAEEIDTQKYRQEGEDFYTKCVRIADALKDNQIHFDIT